MARFSRLEVLNTILDVGLIPLYYQADVETAVAIAAACAKGGARVIEFTNRGDGAYQVFTEVMKYFNANDPSIVLGVGSVMDAPTAALYLAIGANFIVAPGLNPEVARLCNRRKVAYIPGCATETEIAQAEELGAEICKIFPGEQVGGPGFVSAVMAPCPWHRLVPTGGVDATEASITAWLKAGAAAVGIGSRLITNELVKARDFDGIASKVAQCLGWVRRARGESVFQGVEHVGLYPHTATADEIVAWYEQTFDCKRAEGKSSFFLTGSGPGRIEVDKATSDTRCHIAIRVANFEEAVAALQAKGIALLEPNIKPESKSVYLRDPDPDGNRVHLLWQAKKK